MWAILLAAGIVIASLFIAFRLLSSRTLPAIGLPAPGFILPSQDGSPVSLRDYSGKWVTLYFYPKDMTPGCTVEAQNFQRDQEEFARRNAVVLGVSLDSRDSHKRFCEKEGVHFKLLADTSRQVTKDYGSLINFGVTQIAARNTFLIDPAGKIARVFSKVSPAGHSAEVLAALDELQSAPQGSK